jgi:site-specific DNA-methyltransferase (adenine-specific)
MVDAPYSAKTHSGHDAGTAGVQPTAEKRGGYKRKTRAAVDASYKRRAIDYSAWTKKDVDAFVDAWAPRCRGWMVSITDDVLFPMWRDAMARHNRQVFQDVVAVVSGMTVRLSGDGPSSWCLHIALSRPRTREFSAWGTTRGAYVGAAEKQTAIGGKPEWLMRDLITDYTRPGQTVVDPCAGGATTLLAAYQTGRRAIGAELDPATYAKAKARLDRALAQPHLFDPGLQRAVQERLV